MLFFVGSKNKINYSKLCMGAIFNLLIETLLSTDYKTYTTTILDQNLIYMFQNDQQNIFCLEEYKIKKVGKWVPLYYTLDFVYLCGSPCRRSMCIDVVNFNSII